ncbi:MAG: response regulator [Myxococcota bacterium]
MMSKSNRIPKVIVADDDAEMRSLIATALRRQRCEVIETKNGFEMLDELCSGLFDAKAEAPADLIISDLRMPGVTGMSLLAGLRSAGWNTPFILITAYGGAEVHLEAFRHGADACVDKPFDIDHLRRVAVSVLAAAGVEI